jgi:hypothetical protein
MKPTFIALLILLLLSSCKSVEERIKDYSYTDEWYFNKLDTGLYQNNFILKDRDIYERYQVYQTKSGRKYILVLNKKQTKLKRKYLPK